MPKLTFAQTITLMDNPWYMKWHDSPFYHKLHHERKGKEAPGLINNLLTRLALQGKSPVLDTACGRGEISKLWADHGFDVTGIDLSPVNIEWAKQGEQDRLHFFIHDIRLPLYSNYFQLAFNFFNAFGYFRTRREHEAAIRTISKSLKPGGLFIIDYLNVHYEEEHLVARETKEVGDTRYDIHRWQDDEHFYKRITVTDGSLARPLEITEQISKFSPGDFTDMLSYQGLQVKEVFGDRQLGAYDIRKTPGLIIIAEKKMDYPADKEKRLYSDGRRTDALT